MTRERPMFAAAGTTLDVHVYILELVQWVLFCFVSVLARQELHLYLFSGYGRRDIWSGLIVARVTELGPRLPFCYRFGHQPFFDLVGAHHLFLLVVFVPPVFCYYPVVTYLFGL